MFTSRLSNRCLVFLITSLFAHANSALPANAAQPNVLLITADYMNWDSLGCFGNPLAGVSPNLDRLAQQGVRFEQAYVTIAKKMVSSIDLAPTILDAVGMDNLAGADGKSFLGLIDLAVPATGVGRDQVFVHLNAPYSGEPFPMRGVITPQAGYIWNGWANGKKVL